MNLHDAAVDLEAYIRADIPVCLEGDTGIGKSQIVNQVVRKLALPMIDSRLALYQPVDMTGLPYVNAGRAHWARPSFIPDADRDGPEGVWFLDEITAVLPTMQVLAYGIILDRRAGEHPIPPGWRIVCAGNATTHRAAAQKLSSALENRLAWIECEVDHETWIAHANSAGFHPALVAFIRFRPQMLHTREGATGHAFASPRSYSQLSKVLDLSVDHEILQRRARSIIGEGPAAELRGFLQVYKDLPGLATIVADPMGAPVPTSPAILYAVTAALARVANDKNIEGVVKYGMRLPAEHGVILRRDIMARSPQLQETRPMIELTAARAEHAL